LWDGAALKVGFAKNVFSGDVVTRTLKDYNGFNQLIRILADKKPTTYAYRPDGLRHSKTIGPGTDAITHIHLWDGNHANMIFN